MAVSTQNQTLAVAVGTKVLIEVNGELQSWEIVNPGESDIQDGKVSCNAPIIRCILGKKEGDKVNAQIADRNVIIVVKKIKERVA